MGKYGSGFWSGARPQNVAWLRLGHPNEEWHLDWIKVHRADVEQVLCGEASAISNSVLADNTAQKNRPPAAKPRTNQRVRPVLERARAPIAVLYPSGVPTQAALPNSSLFRAVGEKLKAEKQMRVSDTTILRAAGRRK
jgi:hypothetical protein